MEIHVLFDPEEPITEQAILGVYSSLDVAAQQAIILEDDNPERYEPDTLRVEAFELDKEPDV